jgi:hypothetical protein
MSWNIFQLKIPPPMPLSTDVAHWGVNGANNEIPPNCSYMPSWCGRVSRLKDACHAHIIFDIIHVFINVHHAVSLSSFVIPINGIVVKLSWNGMEHLPINKPITIAIIHRHRMLSSERGQRWNSFNLCLYASKFEGRLYLLNHREWCNVFLFEDLFQESLPPL